MADRTLPLPLPTSQMQPYMLSKRLCQSFLRKGECEKSNCGFIHDQNWHTKTVCPTVVLADISNTDDKWQYVANIIKQGYISTKDNSYGFVINLIIPSKFIFFTDGLKRLSVNGDIRICDIFWRWNNCPKEDKCNFMHVSDKWPGKQAGMPYPVRYSILCLSVINAAVPASAAKQCKGKDSCPYAHSESDLLPYEEETRVTEGNSFLVRLNDSGSKEITVTPSLSSEVPVYYSQVIPSLINATVAEESTPQPALCKQFLRSRCIRDYECNFAHVDISPLGESYKQTIINGTTIGNPVSAKEKTSLASSSSAASVPACPRPALTPPPITTAPLQVPGISSFAGSSQPLLVASATSSSVIDLPVFPTNYLEKDSSEKKEPHQADSEIEQLKKEKQALEAAIASERMISDELKSENAQLKGITDFLMGQMHAYQRIFPQQQPSLMMPMPQPMLFSPQPSHPMGASGPSELQQPISLSQGNPPQTFPFS